MRKCEQWNEGIGNRYGTSHQAGLKGRLPLLPQTGNAKLTCAFPNLETR
jgi:hypothetical protein